jgi:hypothetical protein
MVGDAVLGNLVWIFSRAPGADLLGPGGDRLPLGDLRPIFGAKDAHRLLAVLIL